jgi:uncharacterized protein with FMN-binding domain
MAPKRTNLVALGSAAVLAVYSAGYVRTRAAAEAYAQQPPEIRPAISSRPVATPPVTMTPSTTVVAKPASTAAEPVAPKKEHRKTSMKAQAIVAQAVVSPDSIHDTIPAAPANPAPAPVAPVRADSARADTATRTDSTKVVKWKDGTWHGYGMSRHGDIEAEVEIKNGRIVAARVSQCLTQYSCSWIDPLMTQVVQRQTYDVDYVSGATQSSDAFRYAVWEALSRAK